MYLSKNWSIARTGIEVLEWLVAILTLGVHLLVNW